MPATPPTPPTNAGITVTVAPATSMVRSGATQGDDRKCKYERDAVGEYRGGREYSYGHDRSDRFTGWAYPTEPGQTLQKHNTSYGGGPMVGAPSKCASDLR